MSIAFRKSQKRPVSYTHLDVYKRQDAILKDKKAKDSIYSAIENANSDLASKYISEAMKKLDVTYGNDDIKKDIQASLESK